MNGKKFKTLRDAKKFLATIPESRRGTIDIRKIDGRVFKFFVGTHIQWLNL